MSSPARELPEVELGDPPVAKPARRARWTIGRVITDLAIVMVVVPIALNTMAPQVRSPYWTNCGDTPENNTLMIGLVILGVRGIWLLPKRANDAGERWLSRLTESRSRPKPYTPEDLSSR
jgi:hypothetical protein